MPGHGHNPVWGVPPTHQFRLTARPHAGYVKFRLFPALFAALEHAMRPWVFYRQFPA